MSLVNLDEQVIMVEGALNVCARCGEINQDFGEPIIHAAGCPASHAPAPGRTPARTSDPNTYVWTARGLASAHIWE